MSGLDGALADLRLGRTAGAVVISGFGRPFGLAQDGYGRVYVADMDLHAIARLAEDVSSCEWLAGGNWTMATELQSGVVGRAAPRKPGRFNGPHSVELASDGRIYVTTYYTPGLHIVAPSGSRTVGTDVLCGPATGHFDRQGHMIVTEYGQHSLVAFDADGGLHGALGGGKSGFRADPDQPVGCGPGFFNRPHMCRATAAGDLVVADTWNHRLQRFSSQGDYIGWLGGAARQWSDDGNAPAQGAGSGAFNAPVAVSIDREDRILVTDWGNNRLQLFDADGSFVRAATDFKLDRPYDAQFLSTPVLGKSVAIANSHHGQILLVDL